MYEKILESLKTKYKSLGLDENHLKVVARRMANTVKEETEIENAVTEVSDELGLAQKEADRFRTLQAQFEELKKGMKPIAPDTPPTTPPIAPEGQGDVPEWAKALIQSVTGVNEGLNELKSAGTAKNNQQKLTAKLKELGVSENFYKFHISGKTFESDEAISEFADSLKESHTAFVQENADKGLSAISNPLHSTGTAKGVSASAQAFINKQKQSNEPTK